MQISLKCIYCIIKKIDTLYDQHLGEDSNKLEFMKEVFNIISKISKEETSPHLNARVLRYLSSFKNIDDYYRKIMDESNRFMLSLEEEIQEQIQQSEDIIYTALQYAMVGNFIDFGAMDHVDINNLKQIIRDTSKQVINVVEYESFIAELKAAKHLTYIADNAGEIVFDKIFIQTIKKMYPNLKIEVIVRGKPVYNDATIIDAQEVGLCSSVPVIHNGTDIPGTQLDKINKESIKSIENADLIISKGQGNFETLWGSGKNIYYIFLCKCDLFTERFNLEKFKGVFINEKRVNKLISNGDS